MATYEEIGEYLNNPITNKLVEDIKKIICCNCTSYKILCSTCNKDFVIANVLIDNDKINTKTEINDVVKNKDDNDNKIPHVNTFGEIPDGYSGDFILEDKHGCQEGWLVCDGEVFRDRG